MEGQQDAAIGDRVVQNRQPTIDALIIVDVGMDGEEDRLQQESPCRIIDRFRLDREDHEREASTK